MKLFTAIIALLFLSMPPASAKLKFSKKVELAYLKYHYNYVTVDPGPGWKGYNLNNRQNGINLNLVYSYNFKDRLYTGIGIGYLNFEGINGVRVFADIEYHILGTRLTPTIGIRTGYNHIWNQYEGGTPGGSLEPAIGASYKFKSRYRVFVQSGMLTMQQSYFTPIRVGIKVN